MASCSFEEALLEFDADPRFKNSIMGATSAWLGYELQTLYICSRVLFTEDVQAELWPETAEDLLVHGVGEQAAHVELVQVKVKQDGLTLSDIAPKQSESRKGKDDSLFGHIRHFVDRGFEVHARVVVFGQLGAELQRYSSGEEGARVSVLQKIADMYNEDMAAFAGAHLVFEEIDEENLRGRLNEVAASRVELSAWPEVYLQHLTSRVRECSMSRQPITRKQIEQSVIDFGLRLAGLTGFARQYGTTIIPLFKLFIRREDEQILEEYRLGVNARPEHIVRGLDVLRSARMGDLENALSESQIVLVRGASGQGKSTLCYRYLYDRVPLGDCYLVTEVESCEVAADICSFLVALSEANHDKLQYVYIDDARGSGWVWLAEQITLRAGSNIKLIVSVREEELNRTSLSSKQFRWADVPLRLERSEAKELFNSYGETKYPSFEESWTSFGENGPLMEYIYSLGTGSTLRATLSSQLGGLINDWDDSQLYALYLSNLIGAEGVETELLALKESSRCNSIASFVRAVEREHLMRSADKGLIGPLHPYRSSIIAELLEPYILQDVHAVALALVKCAASSCGTLLVSLHSKGGQPLHIDEELLSAAGDSWYKVSEILKYALWADTRRVYEECQDVRRMVANHNLATWLFFADGGGITEFFKGSAGSMRDIVSNVVRDETMRLELNELFERASKYRIDYSHMQDALASIDLTTMPLPLTARELSSAGFTFSQFEACHCVGEGVVNAAQRLAYLFEPSGRSTSSGLDFAMGLQLCGAKLHDDAYEALASAIDEAHLVLWSNSNRDKVDIIQAPFGQGENLNDELVSALADYRKLYPSAERYCGVQVGTDAFIPAEKMMPIEKDIPRDNLPIHWLNLADLMFYAMCDYDDAPSSWHEIEVIIGSLFGLLRKSIAGTIKWFDKSYEKGRPVPVDSEMSRSVLKLAQRSDKSWTTIDVPKSDRDPLGFKSLISPVDSRLVRSADSDSVSFNKHSDNPFQRTSKVMMDAEMLGQRLIDLVLYITKSDCGKAETAAKLGAHLISEIVKNIALSTEELSHVYGKSFMPASIERDLVTLSEILGHYLAHGLRKEHRVAYDAKLKAGRLMNTRSISAASANTFDGVCADINQDSLVLGIDLGEISCPSLEALLAEVVHRQHSDFDKVENITEFYLFPYYLEPVEIDLFDCGVYCTALGLSGYQIERIAQEGAEYEALYQPVTESGRTIPVTDDVFAAASQDIAAIILLGRYASSVKSGIRSRDCGLKSVDKNACAKWVTQVGNEAANAIERLRGHFAELGHPPMLQGIDIDSFLARLVASFDIQDERDPALIALELQSLVQSPVGA